jgi:hypothetical protein
MITKRTPAPTRRRSTGGVTGYGGPTAFDSSGNGNSGTHYGDPSFGQPGAINNDPDTAVGFNGPIQVTR